MGGARALAAQTAHTPFGEQVAHASFGDRLTKFQTDCFSINVIILNPFNSFILWPCANTSLRPLLELRSGSRLASLDSIQNMNKQGWLFFTPLKV
jgi:hypothetical protein